MNERTQCSQISSIVKLEAGYNHIQSYLQRIEKKFDELIESVKLMQVLEEKHHHTSDGLARAHKKIEEISQELDYLKSELERHISTIKGMTVAATALWTALGGAVTYLIIEAIK